MTSLLRYKSRLAQTHDDDLLLMPTASLWTKPGNERCERDLEVPIELCVLTREPSNDISNMMRAGQSIVQDSTKAHFRQHSVGNADIVHAHTAPQDLASVLTPHRGIKHRRTALVRQRESGHRPIGPLGHPR
jgi:hypothetical protein